MHRVINLDHKGQPLEKRAPVFLPDGSEASSLRRVDLLKRLRPLMPLGPEHFRMSRDGLAAAYGEHLATRGQSHG